MNELKEGTHSCCLGFSWTEEEVVEKKNDVCPL